jgi:hypothetical protein
MFGIDGYGFVFLANPDRAIGGIGGMKRAIDISIDVSEWLGINVQVTIDLKDISWDSTFIFTYELGMREWFSVIKTNKLIFLSIYSRK